MNKSRLGSVVALIALVSTTPLAAQTNREAIIDQARDEFSDSVALGLYLSAMDPTLGAPDSLWAVAGFDLADRLILLEQRSLASVWLRWTVRHGPQWPIDRDWYLPAVVEEYDLAVGAVDAAGDSASATTTWRWPGEFDGASIGFVAATASGQTAPVAVAVEGQEQAPGSESLSLLPGTYALVVAPEGYEPAYLVREVLPGVTTVLDVDLVPLLSSEIRGTVADKLVRITYTVAGQEVCRNGLITGPDGLVLTTFGSVQGRSSLRVSAFGNQEAFAEVQVVARDPEKDLAVLQLTTERGAPIPTASTVASGQYAWSVHFPGCASPTSARTRLADWPSPPNSPAQVAFPIPADAAGAPLIDRSGSLLGLVTGPTTFLPVALTEDILSQARQDLLDRARQDLPGSGGQLSGGQISPGGGFPWKWVGAGVGAAGLAFALTQGGGGGGPGPEQPTTGGIIITFPSGG